MHEKVALFYFWTIRADCTQEELGYIKTRFENLEKVFDEVNKKGQ